MTGVGLELGNPERLMHSMTCLDRLNLFRASRSIAVSVEINRNALNIPIAIPSITDWLELARNLAELQRIDNFFAGQDVGDEDEPIAVFDPATSLESFHGRANRDFGVIGKLDQEGLNPPR